MGGVWGVIFVTILIILLRYPTIIEIKSMSKLVLHPFVLYGFLLLGHKKLSLGSVRKFVYH